MVFELRKITDKSVELEALSLYENCHFTEMFGNRGEGGAFGAYSIKKTLPIIVQYNTVWFRKIQPKKIWKNHVQRRSVTFHLVLVRFRFLSFGTIRGVSTSYFTLYSNSWEEERRRCDQWSGPCSNCQGPPHWLGEPPAIPGTQQSSEEGDLQIVPGGLRETEEGVSGGVEGGEWERGHIPSPHLGRRGGEGQGVGWQNQK